MALLTIREAARLIGRTSATIRRYIRSGRLPADKQVGKFGEEYRIRREDLDALGLPVPDPEVAPAALARLETRPPAPAEAAVPPANGETLVPISLYNELLMKHEQMLVQYGMIRAGGQKLLEYKAEAESKDALLSRAEERYQALRARALKEIRFLRKHLRQAEIEVEDRNIEIVLLQEKITRLEKAAADAASVDTFDRKVAEIRDQERTIARIEAEEPASPVFPPTGTFVEQTPSGGRGEDN
jgi:excisionase family DNA binding protein